MKQPNGALIHRSKVFPLILSILLSACVPSPVAFTATSTPISSLTPAKPQSGLPNDISGRVVDMQGNPIPGAAVVSQNNQETSDEDGWFYLPASGFPQWVSVSHAGFISRTRGAAPGRPVLFRLTPDDGKTILINFAGDTMFGRRFFDPNEDGNTSDGLLPVEPNVVDHLKLIAPVQSLLANADLTVVNLESPLANPAYFSPRDPRPFAFHSTKDYVYASDPTAATALKQVGVDVVDIGNNHLYDMLDAGLKNTISILDQNGLLHFGAGLDEASAWKPIMTEVKNQKIGFVGCTTIWRPPQPPGTDKDILYVASDALHKGGAAMCKDDQLTQAIRTAKQTSDIVVVMIHGGTEYDREPTEYVTHYTQIAKEAGATLIINHHPHVVSGFSLDGSSLAAWSLGNFIFDQTVWPTFESYLLSVYVQDGKIIRAYIEPLMLEDYVAHGLTGDLAGYVIRGAAGRMPGPFVMESDAMEIDFNHSSILKSRTVALDGGAVPGSIYPIPKAAWISGFQGTGTLTLGRDMLWVGGFEDEDIDENTNEVPLWDLGTSGAVIGQTFAFEGKAGLHLTRGKSNTEDALTGPLHRILVDDGMRLSITGMVRGSQGAAPYVQLSWYPDTLGPSSSITKETIAVNSPGQWQSFRFDVTVPKNAVAVGVFLRLSPPSTGTTAVDFDNIRLIQWANPNAPYSPLYDFAKLNGSGEVTFSQQVLPGGEAWLSSTGLTAEK